MALGLLAWAGPAAADAPANQRFTATFTSTGGSQPPVRVIASGLINAVGTDVTVTSDGDAGSTEMFVFPGQGTLFVTVTNNPGGSQTFDPRSCVSRFSGTQTLNITGGTGRFVGASGTLMGTERGTFVAQRTAQGCSQDEAPRAATFIASATGTLHLGNQ